MMRAAAARTQVTSCTCTCITSWSRKSSGGTQRWLQVGEGLGQGKFKLGCCLWVEGSGQEGCACTCSTLWSRRSSGGTQRWLQLRQGLGWEVVVPWRRRRLGELYQHVYHIVEH